MPGTIWERFEHDPRRPENAALRASDKDRDLVQDLLGTAYAEGRLTREELDERGDRTTASKTLGELPQLVSDLVSTTSTSAALSTTSDRHATAELKYREQRRQALGTFLVPTLICWVIWVSVMLNNPGDGFPFPWPIFVTLGTGVRWFQLVTNHQDTVASIERDLEKKERRRVEMRAEDARKQLGGGHPPPSAPPPAS
jgi:hypothetical protein